ncbi:sigma-70 family RNA polymerase sigma factor [Clostridium sporogenes]|uniref:sigma-70 family RNA polymerase sigma factor n=1 Tax=Clostridium sporogenes TaxID=1509 RepID=UPI00223804B8|nr:sigma-70 family RNA polymerase sigma factor [Clostridium sporogenes]MCW6075486.1 sigma-70 family RNA polymerase sigma factor [Clostridium sporogenes]
MNDNKKDLDKKDFKWIIGILIGIISLLSLVIVFIISYKLSDNRDISNIVSIASGLVSIALAFVAIGIALKQDYNSSIINTETQKMLDGLDGKINKIDYMVSKIDLSNLFDLANITKDNFDNIKTRIEDIVQNMKEDEPAYKQLKEISKDIDKNKIDFEEEIKSILIEALNSLTSREEKILRLRFGLDDGIPRTLKETAENMNMSASTISRTEKIALEKLRNSEFAELLKGFDIPNIKK